MFIAALFTIAKIWKQPNYLSLDEWIKKLLYLFYTVFYTVEYYLDIKKKKILPFSTAWVDLESIVLNEIA